MQHGAVGLAADGAKGPGLQLGGLAQQGQRLVGMGGQHQLVKTLRPAVGEDGDAQFVALDPAHGVARRLSAMPAVIFST